MNSQVWTVVLAAGAGRRLASVTGGVPKQYWRPTGSRSLLEETLERMACSSQPDHTVTVVDALHGPYVRSLEENCTLGEVIYQPIDRGTATGVLLPLTAVLADSPDAIVVVTPSDHGVEDDQHFRKGVNRAVARIQRGDAEIVLFAVEPMSPSTDFGWITPASNGPFDIETFQPIAGFVEKPDVRTAVRLFNSGAVWNTMVVVASARALFSLYRKHLPFHADVLMAAQALSAAERTSFLEHWYPDLTSADFCRDVLTPSCSRLCVYTWPPEMGWSDLGSPERLEAWLALQRQPLIDTVDVHQLV